ncbi:hypothetical protein AGMMS50239_36110 [Bacteroidia bacterium]|nr:hypothetical protein AGMMS50239_36110 [Bacteroidia bacterium]
MNTVVVEIENEVAYSFLQNLERMNVLKIIKYNVVPQHKKQKLSERFTGCLPSERVDELQQELTQMRNE